MSSTYKLNLENKIYNLNLDNPEMKISMSRIGGQGSKGDSISDISLDANNNIIITVSGASGDVVETFNLGTLNTNVNIESLNNVTVTDLVSGDYLKYDGSEFVNSSFEDDARAVLSVVNSSGEGSISYDSSTGVLTYVGAELPENILEGVKNASGGTLTAGTVVYQSGVSGQNLRVQAASNTSSSTMPALGILTQDLADEAEGTAVLVGKLLGVDTSSFSEGDTLYVGTNGSLTVTKPTGEGALIQNIAKVLKVHATNGSLMVTGAGRTNATPNLNDGNIFIGNSSNKAVTGSLDTLVGAEGYIKSYAVTSSDVTAHEADLTITQSQISDLSASFSGDYNDLTNKPALFDGDYGSLTNRPSIPSATSDLTNDSGFITGYTVTSSDVTAHESALTITQSQISDLSHFSGNYADLTNKPTIPTAISDLTNDSTFISDYTVTESDVTTHEAALSITKSQISDFTHTHVKSDITDLTSSNLDLGSNKILYSNVYSNLSDLPSASSYHGMFAHVHATGAAYYAHGGNWVRLANESELPENTSDLTNDSGFITTVTSGDVTAHEGDLSIDYSQLTNVPAGASGDVIDDTTPQLGGNLDLNSSNITGTGNINITGDISLTGTVDGRNVASDGSKLDTVATNADVTPSWVPASDPNYLTSVPAQSFSSLTGKPTTIAGYGITDALTLGTTSTTALAGDTALFSGAYADLTGKPTLFSGAYADLTGKPTLFSGAYADLTGKPTLLTLGTTSTTALAGDTAIPSATSDLTNDSGFITGYTVTESDVTNHEAALSIATSQLTGNIDLATQVTGTLPVSNMAAAALTTVQTAASESAQLALTAQEGDVVVRSDESKTYMHNGGSAGTMADYTLLATPTDAVTSVNGQTGVVTLSIPTNNNQLTNGAGYITDYTVTSGDVTAHEGDITITESQISDLGAYLTSVPAQSFASLTGKPTTISGYGITDALQLGTTSTTALAGDTSIPSATSDLTNDSGYITGYTVTSGDVTAHEGDLTIAYSQLTGTPTIPAVLTDLSISDGTNGQVLTTNGSGTFTFEDASGGISDIVDDTTPQLGGNLDTNGSDITFGDNDKSIFGAGSDLQIYHDGSDSTIQNSTGELFVNGGGDEIRIRAQDGEESIVAKPNGAVDLYYDNFKTLETTSTGIGVFGNVQCGGVNIFGDITLTGTVDGRDVATDGTKLDGIATGADVTPSWVPSSDPSYLTSVPAQSFASLTGKPTTISGYGITDALTLGTTSTTALAGDTSIPSVLTDLGISDGTNGQILTTNGSGTFTFADAAGGGGDLVDDTTPQLGGTLDVNGHGISFGTVSGDIQSKTLDDYEEGTWTPDLQDTSGNSATVSFISGEYVKVGNLCMVTFILNGINKTGLTSTNTARIYGLPFTAFNDAAVSTAAFNTGGVNIGYNDIIGRTEANKTYLWMKDNNRNAASGTIQVSDLGTTGVFIMGSIVYKTT